MGTPPDTRPHCVRQQVDTGAALCVCTCVCVLGSGGEGYISQTTRVHTDARGNTHVPVLLPTVVVVEEVLGSVQHHRPIFKQ